ncbi:hypothetical protein [Mariniflexile sp. AS56]|uniref:hypothetical protein n=1 Tax=Mariniflexile sp. AS56 TaxID=3063957 RepID=UPI0026F2A65B|nr:hypothetical protein [Mariniflexile sp. AS56]MDO7171225.1 hypothetical protein [Mariniflexile sp. AS56]
MKDLLLSLVEAFFNNGNDEDYTFKNLLVVAIKVILFIVIISLGIWIALKLKK